MSSTHTQPSHLNPDKPRLTTPLLIRFSWPLALTFLMMSGSAPLVSNGITWMHGADGERIHLLAADVHIAGSDPFEMMNELLALPQSRNVDLSHAFYLGFELSKALTALTLGKNYQQDQTLDWGLLTRHEPHHRLRRTAKSSEPGSHSRQTADDDA